MYRTVEFKAKLVDEWQFDDRGNPIVPGGRELTLDITRRLKQRVDAVSGVTKHSFFGWRFNAAFQNSTFLNVLNAADDKSYLTVNMKRYYLKRLVRQRPRIKFNAYCSILVEALAEIPQVAEIRWLVS